MHNPYNKGRGGIMATFHERFYELYDEARQEKGVGRKEFAARCDVTKGQLNGWLNGSSEPNTADLKRIAKNLKVSLRWLMGESDLREPASKQIEEICVKLSPENFQVILRFARFLEADEKRL